MRNHLLVIGIIILFFISALIPMSLGHDIKVPEVNQLKPINSSFDNSPEEEWNKTFGGISEDWGQSVQQTTDSGYIITGWTGSYGAGSMDVWLIKTDTNGNEQWNKKFGGPKDDWGYSGRQTTDGGYIIIGVLRSWVPGYGAGWLIKTDANGNEQWNKTLDGCGFSVQQTTDGGYIIAGYAYPYGAGNSDVWLLKIAAENQPPDAPTIDGPTSGKPGTSYPYTFTSIDPDGDDVQFFIDWGDSDTEWTEFVGSGTDIIVNHTWIDKGNYTIKAKAKDTFGLESDWGYLEVSIPRNKASYNVLFLRFLERFPILERLLNFII